ncbi:MAG: hypothetical protein ACI9GW_001980 [Halieaceae bacterium]|jgi:hypothetical protein
MSWLSDLAGGVATGGITTIFSGITGLVGGYLAKKEKRLLLTEQNKHDLAMADVDRQRDEFELKASLATLKAKEALTLTEGEMAQEIIQTQGESNVAELEARAFAAGLTSAQKPTGYPGVDKFRALTRPLLTWALFAFMIVIFGFLQWEVGSLVATDTALLVRIYIFLIQSVIYLAIMTVSWWFMSRGEQSVKAIKGMLS